MTDPRKNLPSASSFARYAACPGSFLAERDQLEEESDDAARGTKIHEMLAGKDVLGNDQDAVDCTEACLRLEADLLSRWVGDTRGQTYREHRLWLHNPDTLDPVYSGQPDGLWTDGTRAVVWDFKTGRGEVDPATANWQLRALAALAFDNWGVSEVIVAIIQPLASPQVSECRYGPEDLATAWADCNELALQIAQPGQPRHPSEAACRYCRAKAVCPEAHQVMTRLSVTALPDGRQGEVLDGATAAALLDRCGLAMQVIASIKGRAKTMLSNDPNSIPGWQLREGALREKIVDVAGVWNRVADDIPAAVFAAACSITKTNAKALLRSTLGLKGRELDAKLAQIVEGCVEAKRAAPQLERSNGSSVAESEGDADA